MARAPKAARPVAVIETADPKVGALVGRLWRGGENSRALDAAKAGGLPVDQWPAGLAAFASAKRR